MRPLLFATGVALPTVCWLLVGGVRGAWAWAVDRADRRVCRWANETGDE